LISRHNLKNFYQQFLSTKYQQKLLITILKNPIQSSQIPTDDRLPFRRRSRGSALSLDAIQSIRVIGTAIHQKRLPSF
jgi:hypothetical protein